MIRERRTDERYEVFGLNLVAEYACIPTDPPAVQGVSDLDEFPQEFHTAVVHNLSRGGACVSVECADVGLDREIELFLTVVDPAAHEKSQYLTLEFVAKAVWLVEDTAGYRVGLKFMEVPENFDDLFPRVIKLLAKRHTVS
jgi:hypothetical protein